MSEEVLVRIQKLMRLSEHNPNKHEAQSAAEMAQKLADAYNIDMASLNSDADARFDANFKGGLYNYQRMLFKAVAELNHCLYWHSKGLQRGEKYKHRIVGSRVNVMLTNQMAEYLQDAIERITRQDFCGGDHTKFFKKDSHVFRDGMADEIIGKIYKKRREAERAAKEQREAQGTGDGKSLVLIDTVIQREQRANYDFQYGEGAWDRAQQENVGWAEKRRKAEEEFEQWAKDHPEEHAAKLEEQAKSQREYAEKRRKQEERNAKRRKGTAPARKTKYDSGVYWAGREAGEQVGLDAQVGETKKGGFLS